MQVGRSKPANCDRMGSYIDWDDPSLVPFGLSRLSKNCRYIEKSVATRYGLQRTMRTGVAASRTVGLGVLNFKGSPDDNTALLYGSDGTLWQEGVEGSGNTTQVVPTLVQLPAGSYAQMAQAQNRMHMAFGDLVKGTVRPAVFDNSAHLDPLSYPQTGQAWEASRYYNIGTLLSPTVANGHLYRATTAGLSAAVEPVWPTNDAATIVDNAITWKEFTPMAGTVAPPPQTTGGVGFTIARHAGVGGFAAGRDVYIIGTYVNGNGETLGSAALVLVNTVLNDAVTVRIAGAPQWLSGLIAPYAVTGLNIYTADVATGAPAPALAAYKFAGGPTALNTSPDILGAGAGAALPATNTAAIGPVGNWCAGSRNLVLLFKNRNFYINGMANAAVVPFNIPVAGFELWVGNIAVGPGNCAARVVAFTLSGDPSAGPFRYVGKNDNDPSLGVAITSTVVNDNVTTGAYFNVTDSYLPTGVDVTTFFSKVELPFVSDVYYSKTLARMVYTGDPANRSHHWISETADLESVFTTAQNNGSLLAVATQNGKNTVTWREMAGIQYSLKEDGGHAVGNTTSGAPNTWAPTEQWTGTGPVGPRAVDVFDSDDQSAGSSYMIFVHFSGFYVFLGTKPTLLSPEMTNVVRRINWAVKQLIWVKIDNDQREVHFGLPLDGATVPNKVLTMNFADGWGKSYEFMPRSGHYISVPGRKWSLNDIQAHSAIIADRTLANPPDATLATRQIMFASSRATGTGDVWMSVPNHYSDLLDGVTKTAIDSQYKGAYSPGKTSAIMQFDGAEAQGKGFGRAAVTITGSQFNLTPKNGPPIGLYPLPDWVFVDTNEAYYAETFADAENYGFGFEITNKNTADYFFELHHYAIFSQPRWRIRV